MDTDIISYYGTILKALPTDQDQQVVYQVQLMADHPHVRGHFDGFPVLPGVSQVDLVLHLIERTLGCALTLTSIRKSKFTARLLPPTTFCAAITLAEASANWSLHDEQTIYSKGTLTYEPTADAAC